MFIRLRIAAIILLIVLLVLIFSQISRKLSKIRLALSEQHLAEANSCSKFRKLIGPLSIKLTTPSFEEIARDNSMLKPGGYYFPKNCKPQNGPTAVVVAYRNREKHLRSFLYHIHPILQRQLLEYVIIIVEQSGNDTFNRALLMNVGYKESLNMLPNRAQFQCYIFHDVDLLPEDDRALYTCSNTSIHLSGYMDKFHYHLPYRSYFGGVSAIPKKHFELINGFSNIFFGWGGEDDDIYNRLTYLKIPIVRYDKAISKYKMLRHGRDRTNPVNKKYVALLRKSVVRMPKDGLNKLTYKLLKREIFSTHTYLTVEVNKKDVYESVFGVPHLLY